MIPVIIVMTGLMAGIYFTFSVFIMKSLATLPPEDGAKAMNCINDVIVKTGFLPLFFVSTFAHVVLLVWSLIYHTEAGAYVLIGATVVYVVGMFLVTVFGNIPLNNALKKRVENNDSIAAIWRLYLKYWSVFNHIRSVSCILSFSLLLYAYSQQQAL